MTQMYLLSQRSLFFYSEIFEIVPKNLKGEVANDRFRNSFSCTKNQLQYQALNKAYGFYSLAYRCCE